VIFLAFNFLQKHHIDYSVSCGILTLIKGEDDTKNWGNFLIYFSQHHTIPYQPEGLGYIYIGC
jgi:hypothetical protein